MLDNCCKYNYVKAGAAIVRTVTSYNYICYLS